jgi:methionyl-tRNA synthetase
MGVGRSVEWYLERLQPDALRFALASVLPEHNDTDLFDDEIIRRVNDELVATWGNLVNRTLSLTARHFDGEVPVPGPLSELDQQVLEEVDAALAREGKQIEAVELRGGLRTALGAAARVNGYLNTTAPWKLVKDDIERAATVLWTAVQAVAGVRVAFSPYLPFSTVTLGDLLGVADVEGWFRREVPAGTTLGDIQPLFVKLDSDVLS